MATGCCGHNAVFDGCSADYRRRLWAVVVINAAMFAVEMIAGAAAHSRALQADALDFLADALTYGLSLWAIGRAPRTRAASALLKAASLWLMGCWVAATTVWQLWLDRLPDAPVMGAVGLLALAANLLSVALLARYKDGDANVRSVWLCSRNDALGNIAVMLAALAVAGTASRWPDLIVALLMAALFLNSARQISAQALAEWRAVAP